jgi:hypothetical protein
MNAETWYTAGQLYALDIISEVIESGISMDKIDIKENINNIYAIMNNQIKNKNIEMEVKNFMTEEEKKKEDLVETEIEVGIEPTEEEPTETGDDELKSLLAEVKEALSNLKSENEALKAENESLKNEKEVVVENTKKEILNSAGVAINNTWMKLEVEEIRNLLGTITHKPSPIIKNEVVEKSIKDYTEIELKDLVKNNPDKLVALYKAERFKK